MQRKIFAATVLFLGFSVFSFAQSKKTSIVKGRVLNKSTKVAFNDLKVTIPALKVFTTTDGDGGFSISEVPHGVQILVISGIMAKSDTIKITVGNDITDVKDVYVEPNDQALPSENSEIPTIPIEYNNASQEDDISSSVAQNNGGIFVASDDPFLYVMGNFYNQYQFHPRGTDNNELQINGVNMTDLERGYWSWSQIGGLNDVLHSRNVSYGLKPSEYTFGGTNGSTYIDATAVNQRKGTNVTYTQTNRNYRSGISLTHNSGLMKNGWAYSLSASRRWGNKGYIPGTFYDGYSFYGSVSKVIGSSQFNLTAFGVPTKRGGYTYASTDEAFSLAGDHEYNSAWGYQDGKVRNSKITDVFQPVFIANYTYTPSDRTKWNTSLGYEFGKYKSSSLDYYNAYSPYPDYYRNFPSYYLSFTPPATAEAAAIRTQLLNNPRMMQIDWDELYNSNYINKETIKNVNGIAGNDVTGRRSLYVMSNSVDNQKKFSFNTNIEHNINKHYTVTGGLKFISQQDEYYKQLTDLLGGDFYVNYNQFATQTTIANPNYNQNNMNVPNQLIKVGDRYGYDYIGKIQQGNAWGQLVAIYNKVDFFAAADAGITSYSREGMMKNGLFPDNSYGTSPAHSFFTYKVKAGITYKLDLRNFLYVNAAYVVEPPSISNTYISARTRDFVVNNPTTSNSQTLECGYMMKSPKVNVRITGYVTETQNYTNIQRFYNDDPALQTYVNYVMQNIGMRSIGTEMSASIKLNGDFTVVAIASVGQTFYTNRPTVSVYNDNDPTMTPSSRQVYMKNYYVGIGPQSIYSLGVNYHPRSWRINLSGNYIDRNYLDVNPDRLTQQAVDLVVRGSQQWQDILAQEKLPAAFTLDLNAGKSININSLYKKLHHRTSLYCSAGIYNLLNDQDIKVAGYEQLRYNFVDRSVSRFQSKYNYALGINFYASISLRF